MNKVILQDHRPTKKISLPSVEGSIVEIYPSLLVKDVMSNDIKKIENEVEYGIESMSKLIKSWNFTNEKGEDLPITLENIKILEFKDLQFLMEEITKFASEVKKN